MNPFVWRGPEFLLFFLLVAAGSLLWQAFRKAQRQPAAARRSSTVAGIPNQPLNLKDPYEVAYLRSGRRDAVRVAVVRLLDEKVLRQTPTGGIVRAEAADLAEQSGPRLGPVEQAVYDFCKVERRPHEIPTSWVVQSALDGEFSRYDATLKAGGYLIDGTLRRQNRSDALYASTFLAGIAYIKIMLALSNGHRNIWFLVALTLVAVVTSLAIGFSGRVTEYGSQTLGNLRKLSQPAVASSGFAVTGGELAMAAALFGFAALPSMAGEQYRKMYGADGSSGTEALYTAGSSCGGSGGGSSCGGGGCGSGCGGCGGGGA